MAVELDETSGSLTYTDDGRVTVLEGHDFHLAVIGRDLSNSTYIKLVTSRYVNTGSVVTFFKSRNGFLGMNYVWSCNCLFRKLCVCVSKIKSKGIYRKGFICRNLAVSRSLPRTGSVLIMRNCACLPLDGNSVEWKIQPGGLFIACVGLCKPQPLIIKGRKFMEKNTRINVHFPR
jgi:hypothetical protein